MADYDAVMWTTVYSAMIHASGMELPRRTVPWPVIGILLSDGPSEAISLHYFGPLPIISNESKYILLPQTQTV